jgi:hypothetical protein
VGCRTTCSKPRNGFRPDVLSIFPTTSLPYHVENPCCNWRRSGMPGHHSGLFSFHSYICTSKCGNDHVDERTTPCRHADGSFHYWAPVIAEQFRLAFRWRGLVCQCIEIEMMGV